MPRDRDLAAYSPALRRGADLRVDVDLGDINDANGNELLEFDSVASAVNQLRVVNAATGSGPALESQGGDTNIDLLLTAKGTGAIVCDNGTDPVQIQLNGAAAGFNNDIVDVNGNELLSFYGTASAVNEIGITNSATGVNPIISCEGEANTGITFSNSESEEILILDSVATSVNELTIRSAATGNKPIVAATGEADNGIEFHNDQAEEILILQSAATSVNEVTVTSAATGAAPSIAATGDDTNIELTVDGKGTGGVLGKRATEIVTATNVLTAAESGKVCFLNSATEFVSTLPAPAQGLHFKFIVTAAPSGASYTVVTNGGANIIEGAAEVANSAVAAVNEDTITFTDGAAAVGDWVEVVSDGTSWFVSGHGVAATAIAFTAT